MEATNLLWETWVTHNLKHEVQSVFMHYCMYVTCVIYIALQLFNTRANASLTLIDESCPAGFEIVGAIISERYACQCSKTDLNIQGCNETTEDVLLKVRMLCVWYQVLHAHHTNPAALLVTPYLPSISPLPYVPLHINPHPLPRLMQDWLWGTPIINSEGTKVLFTTDCSRSYCRCQLWYTDNVAECRFTVSQDLAQRDQQCTCNRQGEMWNNVP